MYMLSNSVDLRRGNIDCPQETVYIEVTQNCRFSLYRVVDDRMPEDSIGKAVPPSSIREILTEEEAFQGRKWIMFRACYSYE